ncbi:NAD-dependent dehydratase [Paenibacillus baekrokdamisoli]|uniref:NAD-dependent dehydratase n=1 Tax=Paenibacillus baekrokdamisoli TaxID=1712516 RepID=A0A3G9J7R1_9BACL|nr:NAD-dependent epimerase/dehydratase family protein [Paenibacillus baekrokdamisoli]MBB3071649.1 nucleoside-diphosphate-sugar epimerase [Paenibacillus baekrokdamisoli]BBH21841.1 NAD-dependent dehydratase [Paenibacillus baekrokdamisoli]
MNIVVTGAAGFLGSHLTKELLMKGNHVIGVDNLSTGKISNLDTCFESKNFSFIDYDVSDQRVIEVLENYKVKIHGIYHLASPASPKFYQSAPFETISINTDGTRNMLELAKRKAAKLVYASTSEAYGDPEQHPQSETYNGNVNTWGPRACYDEAKRLGEVYCYEYYSRFGVEVKVARIFNTYSAGLRNDDGRVISNFITQALMGADITVYGDGSQTRSFCYVDDNVRGLQLLMECAEATGQIINIGNPIEYQIIEVANLVLELTGSSSSITYHPLPEDDPKVRRPVIDKAINLLGWEPKVDLKDGLMHTIEAYRRNLIFQ